MSPKQQNFNSSCSQKCHTKANKCSGAIAKDVPSILLSWVSTSQKHTTIGLICIHFIHQNWAAVNCSKTWHSSMSWLRSLELFWVTPDVLLLSPSILLTSIYGVHLYLFTSLAQGHLLHVGKRNKLVIVPTERLPWFQTRLKRQCL